MSLDPSSNPLAVLTFLSTPAVLTNASCVLLFGTGNRYGRAIDRVHELAEMVGRAESVQTDERELRQQQLRAAERRARLIVRALSCFYTAVACFTASTLCCLLGMVLRGSGGSPTLLTLALAAGCIGTLAIITGAVLLVQESWFSFRVLTVESRFLERLLA